MNVRRPAAHDFAGILALMRAADVAATGKTDWTEAALRTEWSEFGYERNARVVEVDGRLAGFVALDDRGGGRFIADGYVAPDLRGRGVGTAILRLAEEDVRAAMASLPHDVRVYLQSPTLSTDEAAACLYRNAGYALARRDHQLMIELDDEPVVPAVDGIAIRAYRHPLEARVLHETLEQAFAKQRDHRRRSFDEWSQRVFERAHFDPTLCWLAAAGAEVVGAVIAGWKQYGDWGWIGTLGVVPAARGRRVGEALLVTAFRELRRRGERTVALSVDATTPSAATGLYERVGMRVFSTVLIYEKELRAA